MPHKTKSTTPTIKHKPDVTIGLFVNDIEDNYENTLLRGILDIFQNEGIKLICFAGAALCSPRGFEAQRNVLYKIAAKANLNGLIIPGTMTHPVTLQEIETFCNGFAPRPIVTVALVLPNIPGLIINNETGIQKLVTHLIESHGYKQIAFIGGPQHQEQQEAQKRYNAFVNTMANHNLTVNPKLVVNGDYSYGSGKAAMETLLEQPNTHFDAVVAANDLMALAAIEVLQSRGIRVPEDVAVTGFDDVEESKYNIPTLTTVRQMVFEQGQRAAKILLDMLAGTAAPNKPIVVPARLVVRESCGCKNQTVRQILPLNTAVTTEHESLPPLEDQQSLICAEMVEAAPALPVAITQQWAEKLLTAFCNTLSDTSPETFLLLLQKGVQETVATGGSLSAWHNMLSVLRQHTMPYLQNMQIVFSTETMWQQSRLIIAHEAEWAQARKRIQAEQKVKILQKISKLLDTAFTMTDLLDATCDALMKLGVKACYLSLYENPKQPDTWANLVMGYNKNGRITVPESGLRFNTAQLAPNGLLDETMFSVVEALYAREDQLGFIVLETEASNQMIFDTLRSQISSGLQRVLLVEQQKQAEQELTQQAKQLEAVALMSIATSTILNSRDLLQTVVELTKDSFDMTYVHIGLLNETGDTLIMAAGAGNVGERATATKSDVSIDQEQSLVAQTARLKQGYIANNVETEPKFMPHPLMPETRSEMVVPMIVADELIGVLDVQSNQIDRFTAQDMHIFSILASQVAVALENVRRFEKEQQISTTLEETGSFLDSIIENIPNPLSVKNASNLKFVRWNKANEELTGLAAKDVVGKTLYDILPKEDADLFNAQDQNVLTSGKTANIQEIQFKTKHGMRTLLTKKAPIYGSNGEIKYVLGIFEDVTQQKQSEAALTEERNLLRTVIDNMPDYVYVKNIQSQFLVNNRAHINLLGAASQEELVGKTDYDVFPEELADEYFINEQAIIKTGKSLNNREEHNTNLAGQTTWVLTTKVPLQNSQGEVVGLVGVSRDVTEYKQLIQQIQESLDRRGQQVEASTEVAQRIAAATEPEALFQRIVQLIQHRFNYYHVHVYTLEKQRLIMQAGTGNAGKMMKHAGHQISLSAKSLVARAARSGEPVLAANVFREPDWLPNALLPETQSEAAIPIKLGKQVLGVLDVQHHIAGGLGAEDEILLMGLCGQIAVAIDYRRAEVKRREAERSLKKYATELERSNRELQDFAYVASHDLQEPLRKIQAFGDRLQTKYSDSLDDRGRDYLNRMHNAAARMQVLIQDLLTYSKVTTAAQPFTRVNLAIVLEGVLSDLEIIIDDVNGQVKTSTLPTIDADKTQMRQLFQNLISNALKFHRPNTPPVIKISSKLMQTPETEEEIYQIIVQDNGIGFEQKYVDRIFGVFQRLHGRGEYKGTGVGLAVCKKIAERHSGTIAANSTPDKGTTFTITLPAKQPQESN